MENCNRLVVADAGWAKSAPDWLLKAVEGERLISGFADLEGSQKEEVGDAEACLYLFTACLVAPPTHEIGNCYTYLCCKLMKKQGAELPEEFKAKLEIGLTADEERELTALKRELWRTRGGKIKSPLFDMLKKFKKECEKPLSSNINERP